MRKRLLLFLSCFLLSLPMLKADLPFRNHRYDAFKVLSTNDKSIVFIGNSITNMNEWWETFSSNPNVMNRGVSGAVTDEALANIDAVAAGKPAKVFMMIGTNDLGTDGINNAAHVLQNTKFMVEYLQKVSPATQIYIQSILPSTNGIRTLEVEKETNAALKAFCAERGLTYIDLWDDLLSLTQNQTHTFDGLHLKASGYQVWASKIAQYVGSPCAYPDNAVSAQQHGGIGNAAYAMRATCFSMLPVASDDVLIIGDEMIHGGEWHELLQSDKVKSRGTGWGFPGPGLDITSNEIPLILNNLSGKGMPSRICLHIGVSEVTGSADLTTTETNYKAVVNKVKAAAPSAKIYLLGIQPHSNATTNTNRVVPFNAKIKAIADADSQVEYVDLYTDFVSGNVGNSKYFTGNYLYGMGYAKVAQKIAAALNDPAIVALTDAQAQANYDRFEMRTTLAKAIFQVSTLPEGNGVGEYSAEALAPLKSKLDAAYDLLVNGGTAAQFQQMGTEITTAVNALLQSINLPQTSTATNEVWYQLYTPNRGTRYLASQGAGAQVLGETESNYAKTHWKFEARTDGSWNIINRADNSYLNPSAAYNSAISTTASVPNAGWKLSYSNSPGTFIISSGTVQLNQTQSGLGWKVYNWSTKQDGMDRDDAGCQYRIVLATEEPKVEEVVEGAISTPSEIKAGWYQVKTLSGSMADMTSAINAGKNYIHTVNAEFRQNATNHYPLKYAALDAQNPVTSFVYITPGGSNFNIQALNGHHLNANGTAARTATSAISITGSNSNMQVGRWSAYASGGSEQPYVGLYSTSSATSNIYRVPTATLDKYDIYTVNMTGAAAASEIGSDTKVSCSNTANLGLEAVYNGGYFFFPKGTTVTASQFSAPQQGGKSATITISGKTINVAYEEIVGAEVKYSTPGNETWYYIVSAASNAYCAGKAIKTNGDGALTYADVKLDPQMIWCFEKGSNGKVAIKNYGGKYMSKTQDKNHANAGLVSEPAYNYTLTPWKGASQIAGAYTIKSDASAQPIHAQQDNVVIVTWAAADNGASLWAFQELTADELAQEITVKNMNVQHAAMAVGIGANDYAMLRMGFDVEGLTGEKSIQGLTGSLNSNAAKKVKVYQVNDTFEYYAGKQGATLLGEAVPAQDGAFDIKFTTPVALKNGAANYYWLVADISEDAEEGETLDAEIKTYTLNGEVLPVKNGNPDNTATVFLSASTVEHLGTHGSRYYRIPAITTANNGWLVAVTDRRFGSNGDLPNNIDVIARVSKDNGATWTEPVVIAGTAALGGDYGHGDPAIVTDRVTGDIVVLVTSKVGFFSGTPTNPPLIKCIISHDNGLTWDAPVDITSQIYGATCSDPVRKQFYSLFVSSGAFMQKQDGTLMAVAPVRKTSSTSHGEFGAHVISSTDHGKTWTMGNVSALLDADESKIVELANGDLLVSSRHGGTRYYATSSDNGLSWSARGNWSQLQEPNCNGDMIRLTSVSGGSNKNRLLHSIPNATSRRNVSVFLSTDEGKTWPVKKSICPKGSAYSSLTVLPDGTIGCYYEEDGLVDGYEMRFVRFSLKWLTDGADEISGEDVEVGIFDVPVGSQTEEGGYIYDIQGRRVAQPTAAGVYIMNGKKVLVK